MPTDTTDTGGPLAAFFSDVTRRQRYPGKIPRFGRDDVVVWRRFEPLAWDALAADGASDGAAYWIAQYAAKDALEEAVACLGHSGITTLITIARSVSRLTDD